MQIMIKNVDLAAQNMKKKNATNISINLSFRLDSYRLVDMYAELIGY